MNNFEQYDKIDTVRDKKKQQQKLLKANEENKIYRNSELTFSRQYVPIQTISSEITHSIPHNGNFVQSNQNYSCGQNRASPLGMLFCLSVCGRFGSAPPPETAPERASPTIFGRLATSVLCYFLY